MALVPLAARALWWLPAFQERRVASLSLTELASLTRAEPANGVALFAYGQKLYQEGRFAEALVPLQNAAGQDPDDGRVRESWSLAQIAGGFFTGAFGQLTQFVGTHPKDSLGRRALGRFYLTQRSYRRAVDELKEATQLAPQDPEAWSLLAAAERELGENELAYAAARTAARLRPQSPADTLQLAQICWETNRGREAMPYFQQAAAQAPHDSVIAQEWAKALLERRQPGDLERAEELANKAAMVTPVSAEALFLLGRVRLARGDAATALPALEKAAMFVPEGTPRSQSPSNEPTQFLSPGPALEASEACLTLGRRSEAQHWRMVYAKRQAFRSAWRRLADEIRNTPTKARFLAMAALQARRGDDVEVAKNLARASDSAVDAPLVLAATARLLCREGYALPSVGVARRAVLLAPRSPEAHEALGESQLAAGRGHEAAVAFAHAAGWMPAREAGYKKKLAAFYQQRAHSPTPAQLLYVRAIALEKSTFGLPLALDTLESLLTDAAQKEPQNTEVLRFLLRILFQRGDWEKALQRADQLLAITPDDALGLALRALVELERPGSTPDFDLLNRDLTKAVHEERLPVVYYALGVLSLRQGKPKDALPILLQALELARSEKTYQRLEETYQALGDTSKASEMQHAREQLQRLDHEITTLRHAALADPTQRIDSQATLRQLREQGQADRAQQIEAFLGRLRTTSPSRKNIP